MSAAAAAAVGVGALALVAGRGDDGTPTMLRRPADITTAGAALDEIIPRAMAEADVPGVAVALVADGDIAWSDGYGVGAAGLSRVDADTVFQVGSVSKPIAAAVIVQLAADAAVELDEPVSSMLTSWSLPADSSAPEAITLRALLSHTAGINVGGYLGVAAPEPVPSLTESLDGHSSAIDGAAVAQTDEPGRYRYSGGGYSIAELAVTDATETTWSELAERELFEPLGMTSTSYDCTSSDEPGPRVARGHDIAGAATPRFRYSELAAAGLCSTVSDLARFAAWLASDDPTAVALRTPADGTDEHYGLGLHVDGSGDEQVVGHEGVNRGFVAELRVVPASDFAVVVLTNGDGGGDVVDAVLDVLR